MEMYLFGTLEIQMRGEMGSDDLQNTGPANHLPVEVNLTALESAATITNFEAKSTLFSEIGGEDQVELQPTKPIPTIGNLALVLIQTVYAEMAAAARKRCIQHFAPNDNNSDSDSDFTPVAKKTTRKTANQGYVRWNDRRAVTKRGVTRTEIVDRERKGKKKAEEDKRSNTENGEEEDEDRDSGADAHGDIDSEATTDCATSANKSGSENQDGQNRDYDDQPELTSFQRGTAHLTPLPAVLPQYWTPQTDPRAPDSGNETAPSIRHNFAIGQELFVVDKNKNTPTNFAMDEQGQTVEVEDLTPRVWVVDERRIIRGLDEETSQPMDILCYFLKPPHPLIGNRVMVTEPLLIPVEYHIGEEVLYKIDRVRGYRYGMQKARIEGAYVRSGERMYVLRETEQKIQYDWKRKMYVTLDVVVVRDVVEGDILPAEGKSGNWTNWRPSFGMH